MRACGEQGVAYVPLFAVAGPGRASGASDADRDDVLAIPGTGNPDHLEANVAAGALRVSAGEMALLGG